MLTMLFFDEKRFMSIQHINLETRQTLCPPHDFWASVGLQMQLNPKQIATLTAMNDLMEANLRPLLSEIGRGATQALAMAEQQQDQPAPWLLQAQGEVVQQQGSALARIKMLVLQMGIVTVHTLTLRQMALQQSLCYPFCPRMDLILEGMAQSGGSSSRTGQTKV